MQIKFQFILLTVSFLRLFLDKEIPVRLLTNIDQLGN